MHNITVKAIKLLRASDIVTNAHQNGWKCDVLLGFTSDVANGA